MMRSVKRKLEKVLRMLRQMKSTLVTGYYCHFFYYWRIKKATLLLESRNGLDIAGNIFYLLKELNAGNYPIKTVYVAVVPEKRKWAKTFLASYGIKGVTLLKQGSLGYYRRLSRVQYIFTDTSMPRAYVKKKGQIILNTWHGTPLKKMGKYNLPERHSMGNIQRNLLFADYLLFPNDYMKDTMLESYNLNNLYGGEILCEGYPRNTAFFHCDKAEQTKEKFGLAGKEVFVYMPTWKPDNVGENLDASLAAMGKQLKQIDLLLNENQVLLLKLHPMVRAQGNVSGYQHIRLFPEGADPYEVLAACDALITDYSSVFFDFANTRKKIVLFTPDQEQYGEDRGFYFSLDTLPFTNAATPKELVDALNGAKDYDDSDFVETYCTYDRPDATKRILDHVLLGKDCCKVQRVQPDGKERVLLYCGALLQNGITAAFKNVLSLIDLDKRDYYHVFRQSAFMNHPERLDITANQLKLYSVSGSLLTTPMEALALAGYYRYNWRGKLVMRYVNRLFARDFQKHFTGFTMDCVVNFSGYDNYAIRLLQEFSCKKIVFVHSDMEKELKERGNVHRYTLANAYRSHDKVAVVTPAMAKAVKSISGREDNIVVVNNAFDYKRVQENGQLPIEYQEDSRASVRHPGGIEGFLQQKGTKIISVGRYSVEKQHNMLIDAFDEYWHQNPDSYLVIIGGNGKLYNRTVQYANSKESGRHIACLWSLQNPMPIIKQCDLFVLPSMYEAQGLVMLEAAALDVPVFCTQMEGPRDMMKEYGGTMVPNNMEGVLQGFRAFEQGKIPAMHVDFEQYNATALSQFESIFH